MNMSTVDMLDSQCERLNKKGRTVRTGIEPVHVVTSKFDVFLLYSFTRKPLCSINPI